MLVIDISIIMCDSIVRGPSIAVQGGSFEFALCCFAPGSFELEEIRMWLSLSPCALTEMEDLTNVA